MDYDGSPMPIEPRESSPDAPHLVFVLPDAGATVSGGHLYNQHIRLALQAVGASLETIELDGAAAGIAAAADGVFIFDSLYLDPESAQQLARLPLEDCNSIFLAHHLHSLHPPTGRSADEVFAQVEWPLLRRFRRHWATCSFAAEYLAGRGIDSRSIVTVEPAWAGEPNASGDPIHHEPVHEPPRALVVANLVERKGVLELLRELRDANELHPLPAFELRILGGDLEPDYAARCRAVVAADPALSERVKFAGAVPPSTMPDEYRRADLLVAVAAMETFGMALQEAAASGLPLFIRKGGYSARHLLAGGAGEVHDTVADLVRALIAALEDGAHLAELKRAANASRPATRSWSDAAKSLLDQLAKNPL